ncbi:MAG: hypothetical protein GY859_07230 [Desulfobacterales bacterium]|nr:hypothetical protein [Desulfobacterales bacterium]
MGNDNSRNNMDALNKEIEALRYEFSRIDKVNEQYRNDMLSSLTERLESHATRLEEEIKGRFYVRLKRILWGATALFFIGTAFGWSNIKSTIPRLVSQKVEEVTEKRVTRSLRPINEKLDRLTEIEGSFESILSPKKLWDASLKGNMEDVDALLKKDPGNLVEAKDLEGKTAIIHAAMGGHGDVIEKLISKHAKVNVKDNYGSTALLYASKNGNIDAVKALLDGLAELEHKNEDGETALITAVNENHPIVVYTLLTNGANPNAVNDRDETPLMLATQNGNLEFTKLLLKSGASITAENELGETALDIAERFDERLDILELLKSNFRND